MHIHSDNLIKTCDVCQESIKEIKIAREELDKTGVWAADKDIKNFLEGKIHKIDIWNKITPDKKLR